MGCQDHSEGKEGLKKTGLERNSQNSRVSAVNNFSDACESVLSEALELTDSKRIELAAHLLERAFDEKEKKLF